MKSPRNVLVTLATVCLFAFATGCTFVTADDARVIRQNADIAHAAAAKAAADPSVPAGLVDFLQHDARAWEALHDWATGQSPSPRMD